jgi:fructose-1,6-bisphosphatase
MKTITCLHCEEQFSGATPEAVQMAMLPHYKEKHAEIISNVNEQDKKEWFREFSTRWEAAA